MFCILKTTNHRSTSLNSTVHYFSSADDKLTLIGESTLRLTQRLGKKWTHKFCYKYLWGLKGQKESEDDVTYTPAMTITQLLLSAYETVRNWIHMTVTIEWGVHLRMHEALAPYQRPPSLTEEFGVFLSSLQENVWFTAVTAGLGSKPGQNTDIFQVTIILDCYFTFNLKSLRDRCPCLDRNC